MILRFEPYITNAYINIDHKILSTQMLKSTKKSPFCFKILYSDIGYARQLNNDSGFLYFYRLNSLSDGPDQFFIVLVDEETLSPDRAFHEIPS